MECKAKRSEDWVEDVPGINRNIVECKVFGLNSEAGEVAVLIETLWNVKTKKSYTENRK